MLEEEYLTVNENETPEYMPSFSQQFEKLDYEQLLEQCFAMEEARKNLADSLIFSPSGLQALAETFIKQIEEGCEESDIFLMQSSRTENDDESESELTSRQKSLELDALFRAFLHAKDYNHFVKTCPEAIEILQAVHFMPAFLQRIMQKLPTHMHSAELKSLRKLLSSMNQARQKLVNCNLGLAIFIAKQYTYSKLSPSDLMQEATIGLIKAIDRYDPTRAIKFSTYAVYWIRQSISRAMVLQDTVRLPYTLSWKASGVMKAIQSHLQENDQMPSVVKLAEVCQLSSREVEYILESFQSNVSLSNHINNDDSMPTLIETLEQNHFPAQITTLETASLKDMVKKIFKTLTKREAYILSARYGIGMTQELTLQDIADQFKISRERVRQIQNNALNKIRKDHGVELSDYLTASPI